MQFAHLKWAKVISIDLSNLEIRDGEDKVGVLGADGEAGDQQDGDRGELGRTSHTLDTFQQVQTTL